VGQERLQAKLDLTGDKELLRLFKELPGKVERKVLRQALRAGAKPIRAAAGYRAPQDTGFGHAHIKVLAAKKMKRGMVGIVVTTGEGGSAENQGKAFYMSFIEHGWMKAPWIRLHNGRFVSFGKTAASSEGMTYTYMPPRPFMRPAYEATKDEAAKIVETQLREGVEREAAALAG